MKKTISLVICLLLVVALLVGCGGKEEVTPEVKDTLIVAQGTDVEYLDPHGIASTPAAIVVEHIFDTLVTLDENFEVVPRLATSWEVSDDGLEWTFELRDDVTFTDGTKFNAEVVKFNIERLLDPDVQVLLRSYIIMADSAEVVSEYVVKIKLKYPHAPFLHRLTASSNAMVSPAAVEQYGEDMSANPVGTGPYTVADWVKGEQLVLERNDEYWGEAPAMKTIIFKPVTEDNARVTMLEAGDVDVIVRVPPLEATRLSENEDLVVQQAASTRAIYLGLNVTDERLKDVRVRQALNYAIDKQEIVDVILSGAGRPLDSPLLEEMFPYKKVGPYEFDPEKAKELLADAGYADGFSMTFYYTEGRYLMDKRVAEAIQSYLADVGVDVELKTMEWASYLAFIRQPIEETETQMFMLGWGPWILDGDQMLYPMFLSEQAPPAGSNYGFYVNEEVDSLLQEGTSTTVESERVAAYGRAQELIWQDAPWVFLHSEEQIVAMKKGLEGVVVLPIEQLRLAGARWTE
ncbi:MAG: glutathione ABC transporter substrate-binding protein [Firmicutes bacterium]|nr:glutathione ABC transporter substrate-binding protein [Bacillota bacterium]